MIEEIGLMHLHCIQQRECSTKYVYTFPLQFAKILNHTPRTHEESWCYLIAFLLQLVTLSSTGAFTIKPVT